ncbi:MAG TPA: APC family permease [Bacillota bacterium]|nr:APC family permease [Bacillota bacterium]
MSNVNNDHSMKKSDLSVRTVFFIMFCTCCGGAFGTEDMIASSGPGMAILMLLLLPFFWSIPMGLVCTELGTAIPDEGGFYRWVQRALGEFWGFQAGWWRSLSIYVDSSVYVVLAVTYIGFWIPLTHMESWFLCIGFIILFTILNIRGIEMVGSVSTLLGIITIVPFVLAIVIGLFHLQFNPFSPIIPEGKSVFGSLGLGLSIAMWQYAGYESFSTMAGEVNHPEKLIPKAMFWVMVVMTGIYVLTTVVGVSAVGNWQNWASDAGAGQISFATFGSRIAGPWLGFAFMIAAIAGNLSLYTDFLASGTRTPFVMADDNLMPKFLKATHKKYGTPHISIIVMAAINIVFSYGSFDQLIIIDVMLLNLSYIMIFIAAIVLRVKEPNMPRPFKIPLGTKGVCAICICPIIIAVTALFTNGRDALIMGAVACLSGPVFYWIFKKVYGGLTREELDRVLGIGAFAESGVPSK